MIRQETIQFSRGPHFYQIARDYAGADDYIGICDGRILFRSNSKIEIARVLIKSSFDVMQRINQ